MPALAALALSGATLAGYLSGAAPQAHVLVSTPAALLGWGCWLVKWLLLALLLAFLALDLFFLERLAVKV